MSIEAMNRVWKKSKQKGSDLLLMLALADYANDKDFCWPGTDVLAERIRMSRRNTQRSLIRLEEAGEIYRIKDKARNRASFYIVAVGLSESDVERVLIEQFKVAPLEAKFAVSEWKEKGNRSIFVAVGDDNLSPETGDGGQVPDLSPRGDTQDQAGDRSGDGGDKSGAAGDTGVAHGDKSGGPYKEYEPSWNRHEPKLEPPGEPSVNRHARARARDGPGLEKKSEKFFWTMDDSDPGGYRVKEITDAYQALTENQLTRKDRELVELVGVELSFSSQAIRFLMVKIFERAEGTKIHSFAYFRTSLAEIFKRCENAARTAATMATGGTDAQVREIILRAVRREIKSWEEKAA
ncbi:MAG TPA: helix-turn-helix domain-containing protein [Blastocatellia bacterium]|jgi:hypothetical protein